MVSISYATAVRNARMDAITAQAGNAALVRIYDGTPPASANAALSSNTKLSEIVMASPFAPAASGAVLTPTTPEQENAADATGTASFFRLYKADGVTVILQGTAGTSGTDMILNTTAIVVGGPVRIASWTITEGNP